MKPAFPKLFAIGTPYIKDIFNGPVEITEKVDGSQFSFGKVDGELYARSKGGEQHLDSPDKMFSNGIEYIKSIEHLIPEGYWFYCEYLQKPKHNVLAYDRTPSNHLVLFGYSRPDGSFNETWANLSEWAENFSIDVIPRLYAGLVEDIDKLKELLENTSYLGGQKIEGFVVKRYEPFMFGGAVMPLMGGKYVSEAFKEVHRANWKEENTGKGKWDTFLEGYRTPARWDKAIIHLKERGELEHSPKDIGKLLKEVQKDIIEEEKQVIADFLWKEFSGQLLRKSVAGLPEYYKEKLMESAFNDEEA